LLFFTVLKPFFCSGKFIKINFHRKGRILCFIGDKMVEIIPEFRTRNISHIVDSFETIYRENLKLVRPKEEDFKVLKSWYERFLMDHLRVGSKRLLKEGLKRNSDLDIPLFKTKKVKDKLMVKTRDYHNNEAIPLLNRSDQMESFYSGIIEGLMDDDHERQKGIYTVKRILISANYNMIVDHQLPTSYTNYEPTYNTVLPSSFRFKVWHWGNAGWVYWDQVYVQYTAYNNLPSGYY
jgi:hypothetical protein